jgi:hypothetical protein
MPSFSNLDDRRGGKSRTVSSIQTISEREMLTWTKPRAAFLGIALGLMLTPVVSGTQQADIDAASAAKAAAGREALTRAPAAVPGLVGTFITFDVPGAVNGTYPASMNPAGAITGNSVDVNFVAHGFLRASNGTLITFDVPGAEFVIFPASINPQGVITGWYYDVNFVGHAFLRARNGTLTTFDAPGAGTTGRDPGTYAVGITPEGKIVGMYTDVNDSTHGFVRSRDGEFTTFEPPGSIMCGRYRRTTQEEELARLYHIPIPKQTDLPISYNIAPSQKESGNATAIARCPAVGIDSALGEGSKDRLPNHQRPSGDRR